MDAWFEDGKPVAAAPVEAATAKTNPLLEWLGRNAWRA
jgi:hypothetical protein